MAITPGSSILASDFVSSSTGGANAAMAVKTNADGQVDNSFIASFRTLPLGETFSGATTPQPAVIINDLHQILITGLAYMGMTGSPQASKLAVKIIPRTTVTSQQINAILGKNGSPSDNAQISVQTDSAGSPSGSVITNGTSQPIAGSGILGSNAEYVAFTFSSAFTLTAGTTYWVVFERTGSLNDTHFYYVGGAVASGTVYNYASFQAQYKPGASGWSTSTYNSLSYFEIVPLTGHGLSLWQSDADVTNQAGVNILQSFCNGICITTGSAGTAGKIILNGVVNGFSGLITGQDYYVSTTKGAITTTPQGQYIGNALSATQLMIPTTRKLGTPMSLGSLATSGGSYFAIAVKAPYSGYYQVVAGTSYAGTASVSDDNGAGSVGAQNPVNFPLQNTSATKIVLTVPIRKGQYFYLSTSFGALVYLFPEF